MLRSDGHRHQAEIHQQLLQGAGNGAGALTWRLVRVRSYRFLNQAMLLSTLQVSASGLLCD